MANDKKKKILFILLPVIFILFILVAFVGLALIIPSSGDELSTNNKRTVTCDVELSNKLFLDPNIVGASCSEGKSCLFSFSMSPLSLNPFTDSVKTTINFGDKRVATTTSITEGKARTVRLSACTASDIASVELQLQDNLIDFKEVAIWKK